MTDPITLPPVGDGSRRNRRKTPPPRPERPSPAERPPRLVKERPVRRILTVVGVVVVAALLAVLVMTFIRDEDTPSSPPPTIPAATGPRRATLVLARGDNGALTSATLLLAAANGGGSLLYVPTGTMLETPSMGLVPLRDAAQGGDELARVTLENLLGVRFGGVAGADAAAWAAAVGPAGTLTVRAPDGIEQLAPADVGAFLETKARTDIERMVRHQAFWTAWLGAISSSSSAAPPAGSLGGAAAAVPSLAGGPVSHFVLPVTELGGSPELYKLDGPRFDTLLPRFLPDAPARASRTAVQVLNGTGRPGATVAILPALVEAGARVALTGNADRFDYGTTQIVFYDEAAAEAATRLQQALGVGEVVRSSVRIGAVQVTVVVGADFAASSRGTSSTIQGATP